MKNKWLLASLVGTLGLFCSLAAIGQTAATPGGQYVISAKAGGVNYVSGKVTVIRRSGTSGLLLVRDEVQVGDRVTTGEDGNAEILLNPGSFIRLGSNSSFEFNSTDLENLRLNLRSGSAVLELIATEDFIVSVRLPKSTLQLDHSGVFRIDVLPDGSGKLAVFKGKASVGPALNTEVKSGREAIVSSGGGVSVAKFDRDSNDALDIWSKDRAKELAKLNAKFERRTLRDSLLNSFNGRGWNVYNSFGLWVFDPRFSRFLFLPFGYGWSSPYGWGYDYDLYRCSMPWYVWRSPTYYPPTTSGGGNPPPQTQSNEERRVRAHTPPFVRVEQTTRAEGGYIKGDDGGRGSSPNFPSSGTPIISAPPAASPPITAPIRNAPVGETKGRPGQE